MDSIHYAKPLPSPRPSRRSHPWRHFLAFVFTRLNGDYRRELIVLLQVRLPENLRCLEFNCSPVATVIEACASAVPRVLLSVLVEHLPREIERQRIFLKSFQRGDD